jgi:hypothetical protein
VNRLPLPLRCNRTCTRSLVFPSRLAATHSHSLLSLSRQIKESLLCFTRGCASSADGSGWPNTSCAARSFVGTCASCELSLHTMCDDPIHCPRSHPPSLSPALCFFAFTGRTHASTSPPLATCATSAETRLVQQRGGEVCDGARFPRSIINQKLRMTHSQLSQASGFGPRSGFSSRFRDDDDDGSAREHAHSTWLGMEVVRLLG